jgi:hypothetical protein
MGFSRLPRFKRAENPPSMVLNGRDRKIVRLVHAYRFLTSAQIVSLLEESRQQILRRLRLLYHNGYLERPRAQLEYFDEGGSHHIVYGLGKTGWVLLSKDNRSPGLKLQWRRKNASTSSLFFKHALFVSEIMVKFELACRTMTGVTFLKLPELSREPGILLPHPLKWQVHVNQRFKLTVIPDSVFALKTSKNRKPAYSFFFLEADRGTMPVIREKLWQTSFYRKLLAYHTTWVTDLHHSKFGVHRFRVLTVTTGPERIKSMIDASSRFKSGQGLFLFCHQTSLRNGGNVFATPLLTGRKGGTSTILP